MPQHPLADDSELLAPPESGERSGFDRVLTARLTRLAAPPTDALQVLVDEGLDELPLPGSGRTLQRWRALAAVAAHDLAWLKLYEGHTDALATLTELGHASVPARSTWGLWAAEAPGARVELTHVSGDRVRLHGRKAWCSGAAGLSHALLTVWDGARGPYLATVALDPHYVRWDESGWQAVGMAATGTATVCFDGAPAQLVGTSRAYLERPGFWHGAAGIAACWYGAAAKLARVLHEKARDAAATLPHRDDPFLRAHLGAVEASLGAARMSLQQLAGDIDAAPRSSAELGARRARAITELAVEQVQQHVGRALGAAPFCLDAGFARRSADLAVFVRQSHAEHDLATLGARVAMLNEAPWRL